MMKHFRRILLSFAVVAISLTSAAWGGVNFNMSIGIPLPGVVFTETPEFIMPPSLGFYVAVGSPYDLYRVNNHYYLYRDNGWYRGQYYNGPWESVKHKRLPRVLRQHRHDQIRVIRDKEYRHYRNNHKRYRGKHFKPDKAWKEERKEDRRERKEERRENRERWHDERQNGHGHRR